MVIKRTCSFIFDVVFFSIVFIFFEHVGATFFLFFTVSRPFDINVKGTSYIFYFIPLIFALYESGIIFKNSPGRKIFRIRISFHNPNTTAKLIKCLSRSILFFAFPFFFSALTSFEFSLRYFPFYFIFLMIFVHILIPVSIILSKGQAGLHDVLFGCQLQRHSTQNFVIKKSWVDNTFFISAAISFLFYLVCMGFLEYRDKVADIIVSGVETSIMDLVRNFDAVDSGKPFIPNSLNLPYVKDVEQDFTLGGGSDLYSFIGINEEKRHDINKVEVKFIYENEGDTFIPKRAKVSIFLYGYSFHDLNRKYEITREFFTNVYKTLPKSIDQIALNFVRTTTFDMVIVGYSELIIYERNIYNRQFALSYCEAEPYQWVRFILEVPTL